MSTDYTTQYRSLTNHPGYRVCSNGFRPSNLRWGTQKENYQDSVRHGTYTHGEKVGAAKLTDDKVRLLRAEYESGTTSQRKLAEKYGVTLVTIQHAIHRRTWSHVE